MTEHKSFNNCNTIQENAFAPPHPITWLLNFSGLVGWFSCEEMLLSFLEDYIFSLFWKFHHTMFRIRKKNKIKHKIRAIITIVNVTILMSVMLFFSFLLGVVFHIGRKTRIYISDYIKLPIVQWGRKSLSLVDRLWPKL